MFDAQDCKTSDDYCTDEGEKGEDDKEDIVIKDCSACFVSAYTLLKLSLSTREQFDTKEDPGKYFAVRLSHFVVHIEASLKA